MKNFMSYLVICLSMVLSGAAIAGTDAGRIKQLEFEVTDSHQALQVNFGEGIGLKFFE